MIPNCTLNSRHKSNTTVTVTSNSSSDLCVNRESCLFYSFEMAALNYKGSKIANICDHNHCREMVAMNPFKIAPYVRLKMIEIIINLVLDLLDRFYPSILNIFYVYLVTYLSKIWNDSSNYADTSESTKIF